MELHILEVIKAVVLGIVEGVTEFLPISSTGHLILVNQFVSFTKEFTVLFDIVIQLGAILAVVVFFIKKLWPFTKDAAHNRNTLSIWYKTILGVIPALVLGALFASRIEASLFTPWTVAISLIIGGGIILVVERRKKSPTILSIKDMTYTTALLIGSIQCLALIPGVSRSAATILGAMVLGTSRVAATEFSFFLAIPTMVAASAYSLLKYKGILSSHELVILLVGFVVSFIVALGVVKFLIRFVQKHSFDVFGYYRIALGIVILLYFLVK